MTLARLLRCTREGYRVVVSYDGSIQLTSDGTTHTRVYKKVTEGALKPGTGMMRVKKQKKRVTKPTEIKADEFEKYWDLATDARGNPEFIYKPWET
jgi:hypothetical protein